MLRVNSSCWRSAAAAVIVLLCASLLVLTAPTTAQAETTYREQQGSHGVNTFTNYHNASGMGQKIPAGSWVDVSCKVYDPYIASVNPDGYWYRIASSPWNNYYYSPANTFMNGDPWGGPYTHNTDFNVPDCGSTPSPAPTPSVRLEQGPVAPRGFRYAITLSGFGSGATVSISCRDSVDPGGFYSFTMTTDSSGSAFTQTQCFSGDGPDHWVTANGVESNHVSWSGSTSVPTTPASPPPTAQNQPTPSPASQPSSSVASNQYVALGDSFSAGEGLGRFFESGPCHRSALAYSTQVRLPFSSQTYYGAASGIASWGTLACSGATTQDLRRYQAGSQAQLPNTHRIALSPATGLVTLTIGGNDVEFSKVLAFCAMGHADCANEKYKDGKTLQRWAHDRIQGLRGDLVQTYAAIRTKAPNATILVLGYPQLFPRLAEEQNCRSLRQRVVQGYSVLFSNAEQDFLRSAVNNLNDAIKRAVSSAGVGADYLSPSALFGGHEVCGNGGSWIEGINLTSTSTRPYLKCEDKCFHPNAAGQRAYAQLVNASLTPSFRAKFAPARSANLR